MQLTAIDSDNVVVGYKRLLGVGSQKSTDFRCFSNAPNLLRQQDDLWSLDYKVIMILEFQIELYVFEWKRIFHPASAKKIRSNNASYRHLSSINEES